MASYGIKASRDSAEYTRINKKQPMERARRSGVPPRGFRLAPCTRPRPHRAKISPVGGGHAGYVSSAVVIPTLFLLMTGICQGQTYLKRTVPPCMNPYVRKEAIKPPSVIGIDTRGHTFTDGMDQAEELRFFGSNASAVCMRTDEERPRQIVPSLPKSIAALKNTSMSATSDSWERRQPDRARDAREHLESSMREIPAHTQIPHGEHRVSRRVPRGTQRGR